MKCRLQHRVRSEHPDEQHHGGCAFVSVAGTWCLSAGHVLLRPMQMFQRSPCRVPLGADLFLPGAMLSCPFTASMVIPDPTSTFPCMVHVFCN